MLILYKTCVRNTRYFIEIIAYIHLLYSDMTCFWLNSKPFFLPTLRSLRTAAWVTLWMEEALRGIGCPWWSARAFQRSRTWLRCSVKARYTMRPAKRSEPAKNCWSGTETAMCSFWAFLLLLKSLLMTVNRSQLKVCARIILIYLSIVFFNSLDKEISSPARSVICYMRL